MKAQELQLQRQKMAQEQANQAAMQAFRDKFLGGGMGMGQGMGITGGTIDPITGEMKLTLGESPAAKDKRESEQKANEMMAKEESEYKSSKALLKSIKEDWLKTNPTRLTNDGKFSPLGSFWKAPLQPGYMVEQWLGSKIGATRNQRADAVYIRRINALQSRLAKGVIGKDTGNLNYQEQIAAKGGVAGIGDPYEVGLDLFDRTEKMLDEMLEARKQGFKNITEKWKDEGRVLTKEMAAEYLRKAGGDRAKAELLATQDRWAF